MQQKKLREDFLNEAKRLGIIKPTAEDTLKSLITQKGIREETKKLGEIVNPELAPDYYKNKYIEDIWKTIGEKKQVPRADSGLVYPVSILGKEPTIEDIQWGNLTPEEQLKASVKKYLGEPKGFETPDIGYNYYARLLALDKDDPIVIETKTRMIEAARGNSETIKIIMDKFDTKTVFSEEDRKLIRGQMDFYRNQIETSGRKLTDKTKTQKISDIIMEQRGRHYESMESPQIDTIKTKKQKPILEW